MPTYCAKCNNAKSIISVHQYKMVNSEEMKESWVWYVVTARMHCDVSAAVISDINECVSPATCEIGTCINSFGGYYCLDPTSISKCLSLSVSWKLIVLYGPVTWDTLQLNSNEPCQLSSAQFSYSSGMLTGLYSYIALSLKQAFILT